MFDATEIKKEALSSGLVSEKKLNRIVENAEDDIEVAIDIMFLADSKKRRFSKGFEKLLGVSLKSWKKAFS